MHTPEIDIDEIQKIVSAQRAYFDTGKTLPVKNRIKWLKELKSLIQANEQKLSDEIYKDLKKSEYETFSTELGQVYAELNTQIKNVRRWSRKRRVSTNLLNLPGSSFIQPHPYGVSLDRKSTRLNSSHVAI